MDDVAAVSKRWDGPGPPAIRHGGDVTSLDFISRLPDDVLGTILSLLPDTKDAGRTAVLSSRWRHLWRSAPLNLVVNHLLSGREHDRIAIVSKILDAHHGPARCLFFRVGGICLRRDRHAMFDGWFRSPTLDGLEELNFYGSSLSGQLPPSVLRFATTLRVAGIHACNVPDIDYVCFPRLEQLKLSRITISEPALHRLLASCTALQSLELRWIIGLRNIRIVWPTLCSIAISVCGQLVIEDAPCLERLIPLAQYVFPMTIKVIMAPKLKVLGYLTSQISKLLIGTIIIEEMTLSVSPSRCER